MEGNMAKEVKPYQDFLTTQVAIMKYKFDYSQKEIAKKLDISQMTVSRLIDRARKIGIVQVSVLTPIENVWDMEKQLENRFSLKKAIVFRNRYNEDPVQLVGRAAAEYLDFLIGPDDMLGVSAGRTLAQVIPHLRLPMRKEGHTPTVVQLEGGFTTSESFNPVSILQQFVSQSGVKGYFFNLPIYAKTIEAHEAVNAHMILDPMINRWKKIDIALAAVGNPGEESIYRISGVLEKEEMEELIQKGAVGSIYARWYNIKGEFIDSDVNKRVFGIPLEIARNIPKRILITAGTHKIQAIKGGLNTHLCDIILTEETTAAKLLS
jgi:deoxyribonucleoside regulator